MVYNITLSFESHTQVSETLCIALAIRMLSITNSIRGENRFSMFPYRLRSKKKSERDDVLKQSTGYSFFPLS